MFLSRNKKNNVYPYKPQFYYIKVGLKGSKLYMYRYVFMMGASVEYPQHIFSWRNKNAPSYLELCDLVTLPLSTGLSV